MQDDKTKPSYVISVLRKENQDLKAQLNGLRKEYKEDIRYLETENKQLKEELQKISFDRCGTYKSYGGTA
tara:strand:+ start:422 stop:631 length:210 start_codon:yes stop_codon:yes gene_type:complete